MHVCSGTHTLSECDLGCKLSKDHLLAAQVLLPFPKKGNLIRTADDVHMRT